MTGPLVVMKIHCIYLAMVRSFSLLKATRLKMILEVSFDRLTGNMQGHVSRSKVKWVKPGLKVISLAGGLMSTSSCIFSSLALGY